MKRIAVAIAVMVAALGLVACGGGSGSSTGSTGGSSTSASSGASEVAEAVKLIGRHERLKAMFDEGMMRAGAIEDQGAARSMEEAAEEFQAKADAVEVKIVEFSDRVQRQALRLYNAEHNESKLLLPAAERLENTEEGCKYLTERTYADRSEEEIGEEMLMECGEAEREIQQEIKEGAP